MSDPIDNLRPPLEVSPGRGKQKKYLFTGRTIAQE